MKHLIGRGRRFWQHWWKFLLLGLLMLGVVTLPIAYSQEPVTLRVLMTAPDTPPWRDYLADVLNTQQHRIRVEVVEGPNSPNLIEDLYTTAFLLGNSPYDLVYMDVTWAPKFAAAGWLRDLTEDFSTQDLAGFSPQDMEGGKYNGRLYRVPVRSDTGVLYYRRDLLEAAGLSPPRTLEELVAIAKILQQRGDVRWGYLWQGRQYEGSTAMFVEIMQGFDGFWIDPQTLEVGLDQPEVIRAVDFLRSTIAEGVSPPGVTTYVEEDTRLIFQNGDAAFLRSWPYVFPLANQPDSAIRGKFGMMPMVGSETSSRRGSCLGGWGLGIAKTSKHPQEALEAIRFLTGAVVQKPYILKTGYVPSQRSLFTDPEVVATYDHYPTLKAIADQAILRPPIAQYAQATDILQRYLSAAITNQLTAEQAMQAAARETRLLLDAARRGGAS
jgi:multiple sugar transport system substrate-binding protein